MMTLQPREQRIVELLAQHGLTPADIVPKAIREAIARELRVTAPSIRPRLSSLRRKLGLDPLPTQQAVSRDVIESTAESVETLTSESVHREEYVEEQSIVERPAGPSAQQHQDERQKSEQKLLALSIASGCFPITGGS